MMPYGLALLAVVAVVLLASGCLSEIGEWPQASTIIATKTIQATAPGCYDGISVWIYKHEGSPEYIYLQTACDSAGSPAPFDFIVRESSTLSYEICNGPKYYTPEGLILYHIGNDGEGRGCGESSALERPMSPTADGAVECKLADPQQLIASQGFSFATGKCSPAESPGTPPPGEPTIPPPEGQLPVEEPPQNQTYPPSMPPPAGNPFWVWFVSVVQWFRSLFGG